MSAEVDQTICNKSRKGSISCYLAGCEKGTHPSMRASSHRSTRSRRNHVVEFDDAASYVEDDAKTATQQPSSPPKANQVVHAKGQGDYAMMEVYEEPVKRYSHDSDAKTHQPHANAEAAAEAKLAAEKAVKDSLDDVGRSANVFCELWMAEEAKQGRSLGLGTPHAALPQALKDAKADFLLKVEVYRQKDNEKEAAIVNYNKFM